MYSFYAWEIFRILGAFGLFVLLAVAAVELLQSHRKAVAFRPVQFPVRRSSPAAAPPNVIGDGATT